MEKYQVIHASKQYRGRAFDVRRDEVRFPDGRTVSLDIVEHVPAVTILPVDADGEVWFVRQYRHPAGAEILELPAGTVEQGEDPQSCAQRELQEEIGMGAGCLKKIGSYFLAPGYSTEYMHVYLATDLFHAELPQDEDEVLTVERLPIQRVFEAARSGEIQDAKTLASIYLAMPFLTSTGG